MWFARTLAAATLGGSALLAVPASAIGVSATCPPGTHGVVVSHNGSSTLICTTLVRDVQRIIAIDCACSIELPPRR